jgi:hypothetical protein
MINVVGIGGVAAVASIALLGIRRTDSFASTTSSKSSDRTSRTSRDKVSVRPVAGCVWQGLLRTQQLTTRPVIPKTQKSQRVAGCHEAMNDFHGKLLTWHGSA